MKRKKERLSRCERLELYWMRERGEGVRAVARRLGRAPSTVSRELVRCRELRLPLCADYRVRTERAHERTLEWRRQRRQRMRLKCGAIRRYVHEKLEAGWTPQLIAGRLPLEHPGLCISDEAIYQWLYCEQRTLVNLLPVAGKRGRRKRSSGRKYRFREPAAPKRSIELRPQEVAARERFGDWEADTVVSSQGKACIQTLRERKSRFTLFTRLPDCTARSARDALVERLKHFPDHLRRTLSQDNGSENAAHAEVEAALGIDVFFCHPYAAWERGSVENANRALRRFFPKGSSFEPVSQQDVDAAGALLNHRPMKCLGFRTPHEVFSQALDSG